MLLHNTSEVGGKGVVHELQRDDAGQEQQGQCKRDLSGIAQTWWLWFDSCSYGRQWHGVRGVLETRLIECAAMAALGFAGITRSPISQYVMMGTLVASSVPPTNDEHVGFKRH